MIRTAFYAATFAAFALPVAAQTVLTVSNDDSSLEYDLAALQALPQVEYATKNAFIDGSSVFSGPLLRDVLSSSNLLDDEMVRMVAINDYEISFPISDALEFDVIIATQMDGAPMSVREKGPLWVMYPISSDPKLEDSIYKGRIIWQLEEIIAE